MPARVHRWCLALALTMLSPLALEATADAAPRRPVRVAQQGGNAPSKRSTVASVVQKGRDLFDEQRYEESIQTLTGVVVRSEASRDERIEAYKLLALNHVVLDKKDEADAFVRAVFVLDENFELPKTESPKFREYFEKAKKAWESEGKPGKAPAGEPGGEKKSVVVKHTGLAQVTKGTEIKIEGTIEDPAVAVETVTIFYRSGAKGKFAEKPLAYSMGAFRGVIAGTEVKPPFVEYYVLAADKSRVPLASRGDSDAPLRVVVPESKSVVESPWFWLPIGGAVVTAVVLGAVLGTQLGSGEATVKINVSE